MSTNESSTVAKPFDRPWRLLLIAQDKHALRVAAAYYALPKAERDDLEKIGAVAGIDYGIAEILTRLKAAGMLDPKLDDPPSQLAALMSIEVNEIIGALAKARK